MFNIFSFQRKNINGIRNIFFFLLQIIDIYRYMWYTSEEIKLFNMKSFYSTPSKQSFFFVGGGDINRNYLDRQSLKSCPVQIFLMEKNWEVITSYKDCLWPGCVSLLLPKVTGSAYFLSSQNLVLLRNIWSSYFIQKFHTTWVCIWFRHKVICASSKEKYAYFLFALYLSFGKHWKLLLYTKSAYDLMICHELDLRSFGQVQGH